MKKVLKVTLGIIAGVCLIGATAAMIYGFNTNVKNWIDDKIGESINDENFKNVKVSLEKVDESETSNVGVQFSEDKAPEGYLRKVKITGFPRDYLGKKSAKVTFFNENYAYTYFVKNSNDSKEYAGITVEDGDIILINHDLFDTDNQSFKATVTLSLLEEPLIKQSYDFLFESDFSRLEDQLKLVDIKMVKNKDEVSNPGLQTSSSSEAPGYIRDISITGFDEEYNGSKDAVLSTKQANQNIYYYVNNTKIEDDEVNVKEGDVVKIMRKTNTTNNQTENISFVLSLNANEEITYKETLTFLTEW